MICFEKVKEIQKQRFYIVAGKIHMDEALNQMSAKSICIVWGKPVWRRSVHGGTAKWKTEATDIRPWKIMTY